MSSISFDGEDSDLIIADTNEFHPLIDGVKYRDSREPDGTNHPMIIMRATYSNAHVDNAYTSSIAQARKANLIVGHYGYMVAGIDARSQGAFFGRVVQSRGGLKRFDTIWCDDEEGSGDQSGRVKAFLAGAHSILDDDNVDEGVYSGAAFFEAHGLGKLPSNVLRWVAAYGQSNPKLPGQDLWQFTDARVIPGVSGPCDASILNGTIDDLIKGAASDGPFRHKVGPNCKESIDERCRRRGASVDGMIAFSLSHTNAAHQKVINDYMALRASLHDVGSPAPVLPAGFVYWTVNP
jgi:Glycosyl hydrolases family 25